MKFCPICGRALAGGEICECQDQYVPSDYTAAEQSLPQQSAASQSAPQQTSPQRSDARQHAAQDNAAQQNSAHQDQPDQQPQPPKPKDDPISDAIKSVPYAIKGYLKDSDKLISIAKDRKDVLLPMIFAAALLIANIMLSVSFFARMTSYTYWAGLGVLAGVFGGVNRFNIILVLLSAVIITVVDCAVYVGLRAAAQLIFAKKPPEEALLGSLIEFGFHCIPVALLVFASAVFGLIAAWFVVLILGFAAAYTATQFFVATLKDSESFENKLVRNLILAASVTVGAALVFWMLSVVCAMNYSYSAISVSSLLSGIQ